MPTLGPANPDRDAHIEGLNPTYNYGQRNTLWLDWLTTAASRVLLAWDVSSIPEGAVVTNATLNFVIQTNALSASTNYSAYAINPQYGTNDHFTEGSGTGSATGDGATWQTYDGSSSWNDPGADSDYDTLTRTLFTVNTSDTTAGIEVTATVQGALDNYRDNNGFIALLLKRDNESGSLQSLRFWSNQAVNPANRPVLTIDYVVPSGTSGSLMLLGAGR